MDGTLMYFVLIIGLFYFVLFRPQQKQKKQREELIASLEVGNEIVTIGGIHGEIRNIDDATITLEIAEGIKVNFQKTAVAFVKKDPELAEDDDYDDDYDEDLDEQEAPIVTDKDVSEKE